MSHVRSRADVFFLFPQFYFLRDGLASAAGQHTKKINCVRFIRGGRWRLENIHLSTCWTLLRELDGRREFCFRSHASDTRVTCLTPSLAVSYFKHIHNEEEKKRAADSVSTRCRIFQVMCASQETRSIIAIAFKQLLSTKKLTTGAINIDYVLPHRAAEAPFLCVRRIWHGFLRQLLNLKRFFFTFSLWWGLVMRDLGMILPA